MFTQVNTNMESSISEHLNLESCSVGLALNEECHVNTIFKGTHGLIKAQCQHFIFRMLSIQAGQGKSESWLWKKEDTGY